MIKILELIVCDTKTFGLKYLTFILAYFRLLPNYKRICFDLLK